jgi:uncharacterized protein with NAD-binding domain and iron-sulfur cluster
MNNRPAFIYPDGSPLIHAPFQHKQADMYGFFVKGNLANLQATLDKTLNQVASKGMRFKPLSPYVVLSFTRIARIHTEAVPDCNKGWIKEVDIVAWIMVAEMDAEDKLVHAWWHPGYIFVDNVTALIHGRELFGYPKFDCEFEMPLPGADPQRFTLAANGFKHFGAENEHALHPLLDITAKQGGGTGDGTGDGTNNDKPGTDKKISNGADLIEQALQLLVTLPDFFAVDVSAWGHVMSLLRKPGIDQIFLKQFPDAAGIKAVYQALLVAPASIDKVHDASLLGAGYSCTLYQSDSFPIAQTLGLQSGSQPVIFAFNVNFDFTLYPGRELVNNSSPAPKKIAILGGGLGSMTAAFYLTEQAGWQNHYQITLYQMGWRLGGKGASGRNPDLGERIEEHGLHIWFGFYANAFTMIKRAYESLQRAPGTPLATWRDAFKVQHHIALSDNASGEWRNFSVQFPATEGDPGDGDGNITILKLTAAMIGWIEKWLKDIRQLPVDHLPKPGRKSHQGWPTWLHKLAGAVEAEVDKLDLDISLLVDALAELGRGLAPAWVINNRVHHTLMVKTLEGIRKWLHAHFFPTPDSPDDLRQLFMFLDFSITVTKGMFADDVVNQGFDVINDIDFRDWLRKHGGHEEFCVNTGPVRAFYDMVFGYEDGDFDKPNVEAGTLLRGIMRVGFAYQGGVMFKMQAGMGDVVFTPLYEVLKARGVQFEFFHRVDELIPDGDQIESIRMTRQANLAVAQYDPLVQIKGIGCWPDRPNYAQLDAAEAALMQREKINLESFWSRWPEVYQQAFWQALPQLTLSRGKDFDQVIFGIAIGAFAGICPQLLRLNPALKNMTEKVKTIATQAYQVWLDKDLAELGWSSFPGGQEPVLTGFRSPFDTWAPMDQLLCHEAWPEDNAPRQVSYFCSAFPAVTWPPASEWRYPDECAAACKRDAIDQLTHHIHALWPKAATPGNFAWDCLHDPAGNSGEARFDSQYWRVNADPSERYVLSVVGSTRHRMRTDESGFSNLFLTGDWIKNGLNTGCVESAVMSGMATSRAISSYPQLIKGETDYFGAGQPSHQQPLHTGPQVLARVIDGMNQLRQGFKK